MMSKHHVYVIVPIMWIMGMTSIDIHSDAQVCLLSLFIFFNKKYSKLINNPQWEQFHCVHSATCSSWDWGVTTWLKFEKGVWHMVLVALHLPYLSATHLLTNDITCISLTHLWGIVMWGMSWNNRHIYVFIIVIFLDVVLARVPWPETGVDVPTCWENEHVYLSCNRCCHTPAVLTVTLWLQYGLEGSTVARLMD